VRIQGKPFLRQRLEKANNVAIELPEASFPERPIRLMYAEAPAERPEGERQAQEEHSEE
jgi:hypothetical protein